MKKYLLVLLLMPLLVGESMAQKLSHFGQYFLIPHTLNPAFTGVEDYQDLKAGFRFSTLPTSVNDVGTPSNYFVAGNFSIHGREVGNPGYKALPISDPTALMGADISQSRNTRHGIGITFARRDLGVYQNTLILGSYAYHLPIFGKYTASLGVSSGYTQENVVGGDFRVISGSDPIFVALSGGGGSLSTWDMNAGLSLYGPNLYAAYAMNQLSSGSFSSILADTGTIRYVTHTGQAGVRFSPHSGYQMQLSGVVNVSPDLGTTYVASAKVEFQEFITFGVGYRSEGAVTGYLGMVAGAQFTLGYAYDYILPGSQREYVTGAHELVVGYRLFNKYMKPSNFW